MYEVALSILDSYSNDKLPFSAKKKVTLLCPQKTWEILSKFRRESKSDPWFNK